MVNDSTSSESIPSDIGK